MLVVPDRRQQSLSFADCLQDHKHYLVLQRDEENPEAVLGDVENIYIERDDQQFGGYGGIELVVLERDRLTLNLTPRMAKQMGHHDSLTVTFVADDSLFANVREVLKPVFRGYDARVRWPGNSRMCQPITLVQNETLRKSNKPGRFSDPWSHPGNAGEYSPRSLA